MGLFVNHYLILYDYIDNIFNLRFMDVFIVTNRNTNVLAGPCKQNALKQVAATPWER